MSTRGLQILSIFLALVALAGCVNSTTKKFIPKNDFDNEIQTFLENNRINRSKKDENLLTDGIYGANSILSVGGRYALVYETADGNIHLLGYVRNRLRNILVVRTLLVTDLSDTKNQMQAYQKLTQPIILVKDKTLGHLVNETEMLTIQTDPLVRSGLVAFKLLHELGHIVLTLDPKAKAESFKTGSAWKESKLLKPLSSRWVNNEELQCDAFAVNCVVKAFRSDSSNFTSHPSDSLNGSGLSIHMIDSLSNAFEQARESKRADPDPKQLDDDKNPPMELRILLARYSFEPSSYNEKLIRSFIVDACNHKIHKDQKQ